MFHHHGSSDTLLTPFCSSSAAGDAHIFSDIDGCGGGAQPYHLSPDYQSSPYFSSVPNSCHLQRTSSNISVYTHISDPFPKAAFFSSSPSSSDLNGDLHSEPVRRVFSTGDLQGMNATMQLPAEKGGQEGPAGGAAATVGRYSAEERKERIERYRRKRNQRNFQKKITYVCRKTLADSRPRVRGRFAKNGEMETEAAEESSVFYGSSCYGFNNTYDQTSSTSSYMKNNAYIDHLIHNQQQQKEGIYSNSNENSVGVDEWCRQMQAVLAAEVEDDEVLWADENTWAYLDVLSTDLLSQVN